MKQNFTLARGLSLLFLVLLSFTTSTHAQVSLQFSNPTLVSGTAGMLGATYKFPDVTANTDAYVTIENIVGGAVLKDIDNTSVGYYNAWQPTVGGPGTYGSSYIKWDVEFKDKSGQSKNLTEVDATGVDIDGDGARVREFTMTNGQTAYAVPTQIPTALTISSEADTDNVNGTDASPLNLKALGPVANRTDIDTLSQDVRIDYIFLNVKGFKFYTGSEVDSNGNTGGVSTDRYHSIYFQKITGIFNVLPITYQHLNAIAKENIVNLTWQSDAEVQNGHFEIEKGYTTDAFHTVAVVMGAESQNGTLGEYSFRDDASDNASHNTIYYRLKIVDASGSFSYSQAVSVKFSQPTISPATVSVYPNPYMDRVNISFNSQEAGTAQIALCNASGMVVKKVQQQVTSGANQFTLGDLQGQGAGIYFLNVVVNGKIISSNKLMKP